MDLARPGLPDGVTAPAAPASDTLVRGTTGPDRGRRGPHRYDVDVPVATETVVSLRAAVCLLGRFPALAGVDLRVDAGEVVLLQGPNGAGKSTLLRLCAGLLRLEQGSGTVLGHDLDEPAGRRELRRRVGLVGHATMLYDDLGVADNVAFWAELAGADAAGVGAVLDRLGLGALAHLPVRHLSAGQRRRTAVAAMVVRRPELWLLDEPHAGLDQAGRDVIDRLVVDAVAAGATVIMASHELERVRPLVSRTVTVAGGAVHRDERHRPAPASVSAGTGVVPSRRERTDA